MNALSVGWQTTNGVHHYTGGGWDAWVFRAPGETVYQWALGRPWFGVVAIGKAASWQAARSEVHKALKATRETEQEGARTA